MAAYNNMHLGYGYSTHTWHRSVYASYWHQGAETWGTPWVGKPEYGYVQPAHGVWRRSTGWADSDAQNAWRRTVGIHRGSCWESVAATFASLTEEPRDVLLVNSTSSGAFESLKNDAASADVVAFDAEWVPDWEYGSDNPVSVLQLAFPSSRRVYVLQLCRLGKKLPQEVQMMLVNPEVTKVGFAVSHKDTAKLARTGIAVTQGSVVDVQAQCAAALGMPWDSAQSLSLRRAAHDLLGCNLVKDKRCACSDWASEELTAEQVRYAALDAWVALRLYYLPA